MAAAHPPDLLSLVYAAAVDNSMWPTFCSELNRQTNAPVKLFGHSVDSHRSLGLVGAGWDPDGLQTYHDYFAELNPWARMNVAMQPGMVGVSDMALPRQELFRTEFYNDWLRHQEDIVAGPAMICYRSASNYVALVAACRARGVDDTLPEMVRTLEELSPHLTRAIEISTALVGAGGDLAGQLRDNRYAIVLIHRSGKAGFINRSGEQLMREGDFLSIGHDRKLHSANSDLQSFIHSSAQAISVQAYRQVLKPAVVHSSRFGRCLVHAHIFPAFRRLEFPESVWSDPIAGCFLITGGFGIEDNSVADLLASGFAATKAEARLGQALVDGQTLYEYADSRALSHHTVRNQMRTLLHKTASRSQADLIRRILMASSPFQPSGD